MTDPQSMRLSVLQDSEPLGTKQRFGLFSQPISTAIGDDGRYRTKIHPRNEMGKPVTQPRNFVTSPTRSGQLKKSFFGPINSLAQQKNQYLQQSVRLLHEQTAKFKQGKKQTSFFPIAGIKPITNSSYVYMQQNNPQKDPKLYRDSDGKVKLQPRNYYTNPQSRVISTLFKQLKHVADPYERKHDIQLERSKAQKLKQGQDVYKPNNFSCEPFNKDISIYGLDKQMPQVKKKQSKINIYKHQNPWRRTSPPKVGFEGQFEPVPRYYVQPPKQKRFIKNEKKDKDNFYSMNSSYTSRPTPSVSLLKTNLLRGLHSSFSLKK